MATLIYIGEDLSCVRVLHCNKVGGTIVTKMRSVFKDLCDIL